MDFRNPLLVRIGRFTYRLGVPNEVNRRSIQRLGGMPLPFRLCEVIVLKVDKPLRIIRYDDDEDGKPIGRWPTRHSVVSITEEENVPSAAIQLGFAT